MIKNSTAVSARRALKNIISTLILAPFYYISCLRPVKKGLVVIADGHGDTIPYSMTVLAERLRDLPHIQLVEYFHDYSFVSKAKGLGVMLRFMPLYARAEYVFITDCFIPSSAPKKRRGTTLIQLWHSGGLMKKVGIDSPEDSSAMKKGQYRNTDVFTASSDAVSDVLSRAMMIPRNIFSNSGVSRIDLLYDKERAEGIKRRFFESYPEYLGKRIVLWAPTFRGDVHSAYFIGSDDVLRLRREIGEDTVILIKTHRFGGGKELDITPDFTSNEILTFADMLITDYSSIYFDYLYYRRPIVLFAPDLDEYEARRGLYPDYRRMPGCFADSYDSLYRAVTEVDAWANEDYKKRLDELWNKDMVYCDGNSTDKLLRQLKII